MGILSTATADKLAAVDIVFYVNLGLMLCALVVVATVGVLCAKTHCAFFAGVAAVSAVGLGLAMYVVSLVLYVYGNAAAEYTVYACTALHGIGFVTAGVYCCMLSRNSHGILCFVTGGAMIVPPLGAALSVSLSRKIARDTRVKALVYTGYAYTYAALGAFCDRMPPEFADSSGEAKFDYLGKKQLAAKLNALKARATTASGMYEYAAAMLTYTPKKYKLSLKYMTKAAEAGHAAALFNLGYYYDVGAYVKKDHKKAKALYTRAMQAGDPDAEMRLGILALRDGDSERGVAILTELSDNGNLCALYNLGVCAERGIGVDKDMRVALDRYNSCANSELFDAQRRLFALAAHDISSAQNGEFFREVTDREFRGTFALMIHGLICVKKRLAADAADFFLDVVKQHDNWEGVARCLVGTLYIDCGKTPEDRRNGVDYIRSAFGLTPAAREVYAALPRSITKISPEKK